MPASRCHLLSGPVAAVTQPLVMKGEDLEPAALAQRPRIVGKEAIEEAVVAVLGHIDDAGARIDRGGFVIEASHGLERFGRDRKRVGEGKSVSGRVDLGGRGSIKKKKE